MNQQNVNSENGQPETSRHSGSDDQKEKSNTGTGSTGDDGGPGNGAGNAGNAGNAGGLGGGESGGMEGSHIIDGRPGSEGNVDEKK